MNVLGKLKLAANNPMLASYVLWSRVHPQTLLRGYRRKARLAGLDRCYLVLSFDCDTPEDIDTAWDLHRKLMDVGICAAYAVPGALLAQGEAVYRRIAETGAEFLNHGGRSHTYFDTAQGGYRSSFFYDQQSREALEEDIVEGDRRVTEVIGRKPQGFRTPHFGTFQEPEQLSFLHAVLERLGYAYSTSTTPLYGLRYGPLFTRFGLRELPVSGRGSRPLTILDSWGCFRAPDRRLAPGDYQREALGLAEQLQDGPAILNFYADPSHVADQPIFLATMAALARAATPISYRELLGRLP